jgi:hypothetical protein
VQNFSVLDIIIAMSGRHAPFWDRFVKNSLFMTFYMNLACIQSFWLMLTLAWLRNNWLAFFHHSWFIQKVFDIDFLTWLNCSRNIILSFWRHTKWNHVFVVGTFICRLSSLNRILLFCILINQNAHVLNLDWCLALVYWIISSFITLSVEIDFKFP